MSRAWIAEMFMGPETMQEILDAFYKGKGLNTVAVKMDSLENLLLTITLQKEKIENLENELEVIQEN